MPKPQQLCFFGWYLRCPQKNTQNHTKRKVWSPPPPGPTFSHPRRGRCHRDIYNKIMHSTKTMEKTVKNEHLSKWKLICTESKSCCKLVLFLPKFGLESQGLKLKNQTTIFPNKVSPEAGSAHNSADTEPWEYFFIAGSYQCWVLQASPEKRHRSSKLSPRSARPMCDRISQSTAMASRTLCGQGPHQMTNTAAPFQQAPAAIHR